MNSEYSLKQVLKFSSMGFTPEVISRGPHGGGAPFVEIFLILGVSGPLEFLH